MPIATWNGQVIADSDTYEMVEGNYYFPPKSINKKFFKKSEITTVCHWKGTASYYDIEVDGQTKQNAAWYYPSPSKAAKNIKGYVAFQRGVTVEKKPGETGPEPGGLLGTIKKLLNF